ncbi:hypothetical protein [Nocardiopsis aegyptia]|uniref:Uncharacterized protein n=1 Tax=Nocardiopsis aegyptia TaxID=220378 RepID=A0A7Z0EI92_9ACTN|nr:hypothetical protein [Nocardiopsis aegyptia]NYJ32501.1 hypothetical protein [Nocardiopsis aegyptia]
MFASLGDRLLAAVVPRTKAGANPYCWYQYAPVTSPCIRRYCCDPPGSTPITCTYYRPC